MQTFYHDLPDFGLPLVTPEQPGFTRMAEEIRRLPSPLPPGAEGDLDGAAVLLNNGPKMVFSLSVLMRFKNENRFTRTNRFTSLLSGRTVQLLAGQGGLSLDDHGLILPGSKRLITDRGVWGNNYDVVAPPAAVGGAIFGGGGGNRKSLHAESRHMQVDLAIFEDGGCAGPDDFGSFPFLVGDLQTRRELATEIVSSIRKGVTREQLWTRLEPFSDQRIPPERGHHPNFILQNFANQISGRLADREDSGLVSWLEQQARPSHLELRRV